MGLFKKEACCICGGKTGMFDKKTADGKICKDCTKKLSMWFDGYKDASADDINKQIAQKESDLARIKDLNFNKVFGEFGVVLIDEENRVFSAIRETSTSLFGDQRSVSSIDDVMDFNPDIISFDQVQDFNIDITYMTREEKQEINGEKVSFNPPHILYMVEFSLEIVIKDHPYIDFIRVVLNNGALQIRNMGYRQWTDPGRKLAAHLLGLPTLVKENMAAVYDNASLVNIFYNSPYEMPDYSYGFKVTLANWPDIQKYQYYLAMAREIQESITGGKA